MVQICRWAPALWPTACRMDSSEPVPQLWRLGSSLTRSSWVQAVGSTIQGRFHAVLMDFGSARPARTEVHSRMEALTLQEDAEVRPAPARASYAGLHARVTSLSAGFQTLKFSRSSSVAWGGGATSSARALETADGKALGCAALQAHCTAPYKAPELYDVPSECTLNERVDIWSLGCLL